MGGHVNVRRRCVAVLVAWGMLGMSACSAPDSTAQAGRQSVPVIAPGKPGEPNRTLAAGEAVPVQERPNDADFSYVELMIVHHRQAIEMTDLAARHATDGRVGGLADRIADAQGPEIDMMNRWLTQNGKPAVAESGDGHGHSGHQDHSDMPGMASDEQTRDLASARGTEFDGLFLELMIAHHEGALMMAREVQNEGMEIRVQEMADDVIATQSAEIRRMREMLEA